MLYCLSCNLSAFKLLTVRIIVSLLSVPVTVLMLPEIIKDTCWFLGSLSSAASWTLASPASILVPFNCSTPAFCKSCKALIPAACLSLASCSFPPALEVGLLDAPPLTLIVVIELNSEIIDFRAANLNYIPF